MLGERIKELRKQKGYSQETLAQQMNVVRQTISKWENGTSVPDAEMLGRLAEIFEVPVSVLLGEGFSADQVEPDKPYDEIAKQLAILNDQLASKAVRRRKMIPRILIGAMAVVMMLLVFYISACILYRTIQKENQVLTEVTVECTLDGETYQYGITYDQNHEVIYAGGDAFIANHVEAEKYGYDANVLMAKIEDYFKDRGGTCTITE